MSEYIKLCIRDFQLPDSIDIQRVTLGAFKQYKDHYDNWGMFSTKLEELISMAINLRLGELIVATVDKKVVGSVVYVPTEKIEDSFPKAGAVIRLLAVDPHYRSAGIGKALTEECIRRALHSKLPHVSLHTSPIMEVALKMYLRMGFKLEKEMPSLYGVPYNIYIKYLANNKFKTMAHDLPEHLECRLNS